MNRTPVELTISERLGRETLTRIKQSQRSFIETQVHNNFTITLSFGVRTRASKLGGHAVFCDRSLRQESRLLTNKRLHKKPRNIEHTTSHKILVEFYTDTLEVTKNRNN